ncbi:MAG: hypothetical protein KDA28_06985, partial [Phycisphaerales bacterium]|nr:hypothetical protein [Phycisphaerales bacterium]
MRRFMLCVLIGAVVVFVWNALAWMVLPHHTMTIRHLPNEDAVREVLADVETGTYYVPHWGEGTESEMTRFEAR